MPWGVVRAFWNTQGVERRPVTGVVLARWARALLAQPSPAFADVHRRKRRKGGGRHCKAQALRDALFEWFCSIRGSRKGRLPLACLRRQAEVLRDEYVLASIRPGTPCLVPHITSAWLNA